MFHVGCILDLTTVVLTPMTDKDIANFIYEHTTRSTLDLDLQGIWINDRELSFVI